MDQLFLFSNYLNDTGCFCLKMDKSGALIAPPEQRDFAEIKKLQQNSSTLVIESSTHATLLQLELSWLPERKARMAIPFAVEDKIAQSVDELHFAFDKAHYKDNRYLIIALSKQRIHFIMNVLKEHDIEFTAITLDWFALDMQESCISDETLLINTDDFKGALSGALAKKFLTSHLSEQFLLFKDSGYGQDTSVINDLETSYEWIARKLLKSKFINLCQGEMQQRKNGNLVKKKYQFAAALLVFWLASLVLVNAINLYFINKQTQTIDNQIAVIYREFFPAAKQVISPKFRIMQLLKNNIDEENHFMFLLNQFSKVMQQNQVILEQLRYQNKTLYVSILSADFAGLENLENQLKTLQLKVKQTQASTHEQQVAATLELQ